MCVYIDNGKLENFPLSWQKTGYHQTKSGYGAKLTTPFKTRYNGKLYRVYCRCYGNAGTLYVISNGKQLILNNTEMAN